MILHSQPRNRIGWLLVAIGVAWTVPAMIDTYATWALALQPGTVPGGYVAVAVLRAAGCPPWP